MRDAAKEAARIAAPVFAEQNWTLDGGPLEVPDALDLAAEIDRLLSVRPPAADTAVGAVTVAAGRFHIVYRRDHGRVRREVLLRLAVDIEERDR